MIRRSRRGSALVEASLIYPVIIVSVLLIIAAALYFYSMAAQLADMNRFVHRNAGEQSGTVYYAEETSRRLSSYEPRTERHHLVFESIIVEKNSSIRNHLLFRVSASHTERAEATAICEADLIRKVQLAGDVIDAIRD